MAENIGTERSPALKWPNWEDIWVCSIFVFVALLVLGIIGLSLYIFVKLLGLWLLIGFGVVAAVALIGWIAAFVVVNVTDGDWP